MIDVNAKFCKNYTADFAENLSINVTYRHHRPSAMPRFYLKHFECYHSKTAEMGVFLISIDISPNINISL